MFEIMENKPLNEDYKIIDNHTVIFNDGDNDVLYCGNNQNNIPVIVVIIYDDNDLRILYYFHILTDGDKFMNFLNKETTLRQIMIESSQIYIVSKNYQGDEIDVNMIDFDDIPEDFRPTNDSYCVNV